MKTKNLIIALTMTLTMGLVVTAYAATSTDLTTDNNQRAQLMKVTGMRGYDYIKSLLNDKLGMTNEEITDGLNSGKTMYTLAEEKGMTLDQFKTALLEERYKSVDKAVLDQTITTEESVTIKENLKNNIDNCTGIPGQRIGHDGNKKGKGHMLGSRVEGKGNCYNSVK